VFARFVCDIDGPTGHTTPGSVERRVWMGCLKHVPVWQDVEVLGEERIVSVGKDVPGM